jgi:hypothetical protein
MLQEFKGAFAEKERLATQIPYFLTISESERQMLCIFFFNFIALAKESFHSSTKLKKRPATPFIFVSGQEGTDFELFYPGFGSPSLTSGRQKDLQWNFR